jgi:two-component system chemotaxis response regulator CheY
MRILIVDDVPIMRRFLRTILTQLDAQIDEAGDGVQALQLLTRSQYDLVFLDLNLPLLDGMKVLSRLSTEAPQQRPPIIVISTVSDPETIARATALGAVYVMGKPVDSFRVLDAAREVLRLPESPPADERRSSRRIRIAVALKFGGAGEAVEASTYDMSASGAFIVTNDFHPLGAVGRATFLVPHLPDPVEIDFEVMHVRTVEVGVRTAGMGIRFVNVSPETQARVFEILSSPA